jgi:CBS domain-containing protein
MATVREILTRKGSDVVSVPPSATVLEAAHLMNERSIGGVAVLSQGALAGIFTERDVSAASCRGQRRARPPWPR